MLYFRIIFLACIVLHAVVASGQTDTSRRTIFSRLTTEMQQFKADTTAPPQDKLTKKIIQLRKLRGGFNINEAILYKIQEELSNKNISQDAAAHLTRYFTNGAGAVALNNAIIRIYRSRFNYRDVRRMIRFYRTGTGQRFATDFPLILLQSLKAAEMIQQGLPSN